VSTSGAAFCWGNNGFGQLGDGTNLSRRHPVRVSGGDFRQLSTGTFHTCGIGVDGKAYCWGGNTAGQAGDGSLDNRLVPTAVTGNRSWLDIDAGLLHTCAVATTNDAYCWGLNDEGQLGIGTRSPSQLVKAPRLVLGGKPFVQVTLGGGFSCGLTTSAEGWCWGGNLRGQLGDGSGVSRMSPVRIAGSRHWTLLAAGYDQACGVASNGRGLCWGDNLFGELGNGTTDNSAVPRRVVSPM
jgi:alpha-tubulin suppressor-like RCC1 family protein